ncbi:MAG: glycosyltransferase family 4 protein [Chloroflexi bacterium]|nr:glycosyltransferase family 4 protein [Chloroflexota bacterium]
MAVRFGINAHLVSTAQSYRAAGTSRYLTHLLAEFSAAPCDEEVWAYLSDRHVPHGLVPNEHLVLARSRWPTYRPAVRLLWEQAAWPVLLRKDRIALAHGPAQVLPLAWSGPSVVTVHDLAFMVDSTTFRRRSPTYLRVMVALAAKRASRIIAVSEWTRKDVIRLLGVRPEKVVCVYEGADSRHRPIEDLNALEAFRQDHGLSRPFILYLGTIEPRKNLIRLIDAYVELRRRGCIEFPLVLAGGMGPLHEPIRAHAAATGLGPEDLRFVGFVPEEEKPLWYNSASLFVYPSQYEGFGLPALEALSCGTPVLTSNRSSLPEVIGEAGMLVDPLDVAAIADGIQRLLEDQRLRERLGAAGLAQAKRFSWQAAARQTLDVYRSAAGQA